MRTRIPDEGTTPTILGASREWRAQLDPRTPFELMESAWAARRSSFDMPEPEQSAAVDAVRKDLERAAEMLRNANQDVPYAHALHLRAHVELDVGEEDRAEELWDAAVAILRGADDPLQLAHKVRHLGDLALRRGRLEQASKHYTEALGLYRSNEGSHALDFANAVNRMALLKERLGETAEARELWSEVKQRYANLGLAEGVEEADQHLAELG